MVSQSVIFLASSISQSASLNTARILIEEEEDAAKKPPKHRGSRKGQSANLPRNFAKGYQQLYSDYFSDSPVYGPFIFRRRFRMYRGLFLRIAHDVEAHDDYFKQKRDALGNLGLHPFQKIACAIRLLACRGATNSTNKSKTRGSQHQNYQN